MKLLDTSVAIDHLRGTEAAAELLQALPRSGEELAASEVVRFELLSGVRPREIGALEEFFSVFTWWPIDEPVSRVAGALARKHRRSHGGIGSADYLIAATALVLDAELLTTNVRHFPMFPGLRPPY